MADTWCAMTASAQVAKGHECQPAHAATHEGDYFHERAHGLPCNSPSVLIIRVMWSASKVGVGLQNMTIWRNVRRSAASEPCRGTGLVQVRSHDADPPGGV
jgi:hypothetical protein